MAKSEMGVGGRLRLLRKQKNLTLKEVGSKLNMTATAISCYETESRKPSPEIIHKLAEIYETTTDYILGMQKDYGSNLETILASGNLHWGGIPLREDELNFIKHFLELRMKDKADLGDPGDLHTDKNNRIG